MAYVLNNKLSGTITAVSGTASFSASFMPQHETIKVITVKATTATTQFRFRIIDNDSGLYPFETSGPCQGTLIQDVYVPLKGDYTFQVYSANVDEPFSYLITNLVRT